jgi:Icc-related predicted phosphoesterase
VQLDKDKDKRLRIAVISATKDDREETLAAIERLFAKVKKNKVDVLVVNGDLASQEINPDETLFPKLASLGVLTVVTIGNTESCGLFNQAATAQFEKTRHFINGNWVRQIELDDGVLYTLPGYYDRRFAHTGGAEKYKEADVFALKSMINEGPGPKILVSHGPPKMKGRHGIDIVTDGDHVGDEHMTELLKVTKVPFGIFGHILEAGGRGSDLTGRRRVKPGKWSKQLYVNAGTANPDPWPLLDGKTSYGMALWVEIEPKRARYRVFRLAGD